MEKRKFQTSRPERLSYGGFFLGQNIIYIIQFQFISYFYTEYLGLSIRDTAVLLLIAKLWDSFNDPIMGAIVDKCSFKNGKYIPWLRFVTYVLPLTLFFLFIHFDASYQIKLIYAYLTYILFGMVYTISDSPLFSLSTVMSSSTFERDTLISHGRLASALAAISTAVFVGITGAFGWTRAALVFCIFALLVMLPLQFLAKERVKYKRSAGITFLKIFHFLFQNKYLLIYYIGYFAMYATNTLQVMAVFFANSNLGNEAMFTVIMAVVLIPVIILAPMLPNLIRLFGKKNLTVYCSVAAIILSIIQYYAGYGNLVIFLGIAAIRVAFMQVPMLIYGMFTADCIEYGAYITGERTEGISFSLQTFVTKLAGAICNTLCLTLLGIYGYVEKAKIQSEQALHGIWVIMSLVPIVGYAIMLIVMKFYRLGEKEVAQMILHNHENINEREDI